jgi:hypothetical protein
MPAPHRCEIESDARRFFNSPLAHQLRDCRYAIEAGDAVFAPRLKALLLRAVVLARRHRALAASTRREYRRRLERDLDAVMDGPPSRLAAMGPVLAPTKVSLVLAERAGRPARTAERALRFGPVSLKRPQTAAADLPAEIVMQAVEAAEINPPPGQPPVLWRLLTTHAVESSQAARQIIAWYRHTGPQRAMRVGTRRWTIEQVFRTLKSAAVQAAVSQLVAARRDANPVVVGLIAALRIVQLTLARDGATGQPISDAAEPADLPVLHARNRSLQGRTAALANPHPPTTRACFAWIVARRGGCSGYPSKGSRETNHQDPKPSPAAAPASMTASKDGTSLVPQMCDSRSPRRSGGEGTHRRYPVPSPACGSAGEGQGEGGDASPTGVEEGTRCRRVPSPACGS